MLYANEWLLYISRSQYNCWSARKQQTIFQALPPRYSEFRRNCVIYMFFFHMQHQTFLWNETYWFWMETLDINYVKIKENEAKTVTHKSTGITCFGKAACVQGIMVRTLIWFHSLLWIRLFIILIFVNLFWMLTLDFWSIYMSRMPPKSYKLKEDNG